MVSLVLFAFLVVALPFIGVVLLSLALFSIFDPRSRGWAIICFVVPALVVPASLFALGAKSGVLRYSAEGPIIWFVAWPALGLACIAAVAACFTVAAIRR